MFHSWAWLAWTLAALVTLSLTRNPLYLLVILLCIAIVTLTLRGTTDAPSPPVSPLHFALVVTLLTTAFNALTSHFGATNLFEIPGEVPLLSGPVTLEALVFGATNGLVISGLFGSFTVLNMALPVRALIRLVPRAFYPLAVVTSIAVTYAPATARQFEQIREAQAVRGHHLRGPRDWLPLLMPLLIGGLERAMALAEAMTARGFASPAGGHPSGGEAPQESTPTRANTLPRLALLAGLVLLPGGWLLRLAGRDEKAGTLLILAGLGLVLWGLWSLGRGVPRTVYRREPWTWPAGLVLLGGILTLLAYTLPLPGLALDTLNYTPYPTLSLPAFDPFIGLATLGLIVPALLVER